LGMDADEIVATLKREASARNVEGMARFGIVSRRAYGVSVTRLRQIARQAGGRDRALARRLWRHGALRRRSSPRCWTSPSASRRRTRNDISRASTAGP